MPASASAGMNTLPLASAATQRLPNYLAKTIIHLVFATENVAHRHPNGVSHQHAYLNELHVSVRFNRR